MPVNFVEELRWRGMLQDIMPGTEELLAKEVVTGYIGFDPTADSLHIGSLIPIMMLKHMQNAGHRPIALVGGATGMVGDPSGKSDERNLLDEATLAKNIAGVQGVLSRFLDFDDTENGATMVNNYDWMKGISFLEFIRDVGKHITVNYMSAKDSVKKRIETGISFTEFSYQLIQGYDYLHLYQSMGCKLQMGGSDQWGNITTGTELVRRIGKGEGFAFTCPLMTKADGTKFGKTAGGAIWLTADKTSPYEFYQYWLNATDEDAPRFIRTFTFLTKAEIEAVEKEHLEAPHLRLLQKRLAEEVTKMVHGQEELDTAIAATNILFGRSTGDDLRKLNSKQMLSIFEGVPQATISKADMEAGVGIIDALSAKTGFLKSNGEARRELKGNAISVNKSKVKEDYILTKEDLINGTFVLLGKGKKNNYLIIVE
ncbi:tyrosine--tRNA ligase [Putridiphycobacter roseus]|uniref:Tyrosine--tRNA ligase n=1 Tax=Putridiphycobacter roseus TaxID=2219161 RepID=A0A2W1NGY6_9FLAO|nr:tyrosine--tRNA ligase [Putridiphycobacter roseus]PZE18775.1 tyrosine--tRNA ligase [Putridiphycobacter roseus]